MRYTIAIVLGSLYVLFESEGITRPRESPEEISTVEIKRPRKSPVIRVDKRPRESLEETSTVEVTINCDDLLAYALERTKVINANGGKELESPEDNGSDKANLSPVNGDEAGIRKLNPVSKIKDENNRDVSELDEIHQKILSEEKATMEAVTAELRQLKEQLKHYRDELEKRKCSKRRSRNKAN